MEQFQKQIQEQFNEMCKTGKLFRSTLTGQQVWDLYLSAFPAEYNPIFRDPESSEMNCNLCKNFVRRYGNIVALNEEMNLVTMFDIAFPKEDYKRSCSVVSRAIIAGGIQDVFFETHDMLNSLNYGKCNKNDATYRLGIDKNVKRYTREEAEKFGVVKPNEVVTFHHMFLDLPTAFVDKSGKSVEALQGNFRDAKNVFKRAMDEIPLDILLLVKDLINQGSLLDGQTHLYKIEQVIPFKVEYDKVPSDKRDNYAWNVSYGLPFAKFKNELIGVLCSELAEGVELNKACEAWNKRVDPANYMKATAPITKKQIADAKQFVVDNGYEASFTRRYAMLHDIKADEILHVNAGKGTIKEVSIFDDIIATKTTSKLNKFEGVEEVGIEKFMKDILPGCTSVEAYLLNSHRRNMVSLTTALDKQSKPIFKWSNNYSWTYNGNLAGVSFIKEAVKSVGGVTDAYMRGSITWNEDGRDVVDLDIHCVESAGTEIYFGNCKGVNCAGSPCGGRLDIDMIRPTKLGVENIFYNDRSKLRDGRYRFFIHNYDRGDHKGCKAEIEFDGNTYTYHKNGKIQDKEDIATLHIKDGQLVKIDHHMMLHDSNAQPMEFYGLNTNEFHKVNLVCLSPNYWAENNVGNKHYFFMLEDCKCPSDIRSFHVENLIPELLDHRKVMEVLGFSTMIKPSDDQLSGIGFNATVRDELIVKLTGTHNRIIKIKF